MLTFVKKSVRKENHFHHKLSVKVSHTMRQLITSKKKVILRTASRSSIWLRLSLQMEVVKKVVFLMRSWTSSFSWSPNITLLLLHLQSSSIIHSKHSPPRIKTIRTVPRKTQKNRSKCKRPLHLSKLRKRKMQKSLLFKLKSSLWIGTWLAIDSLCRQLANKQKLLNQQTLPVTRTITSLSSSWCCRNMRPSLWWATTVLACRRPRLSH